MQSAAAFEHQSQGRSLRTAVVLGAIWIMLLAGVLLIDLAWWIAVMLLVFTLPALWDLYSNRSAGLRLTDAELSWFAGRHSAALQLDEIDHMRFDTRLDFSIRVSAVLPNRKRIRLPYEALPDDKALEAALHARNVKVERHHFSLL